MKLLKLIQCDIYRDGGSMEGIWLTDGNKEWTITLVISGWNKPTEIKHYTLFQCKRDEVERHNRIEKGSKQHSDIITLVHDWIDSQKNFSDQQLTDLLTELNKGNY